MPKKTHSPSSLRLASRAGSPVDGTSGPSKVFDDRPLTIAGYRLTSTSAEPVDTPTLVEHEAALAFAGGAHEAAPYWIADLMRYAETRADWKDKLSQVQDATGLAHQTIENLAYMGRRVGPAERALSPSPTHSLEVAPLTPAQQQTWLRKAAEGGWSAKELRARVKASREDKAAPETCQRCASNHADRLVQRWHLSVGDLHERPLLCDVCAPLVAQAVKNALAPIFMKEAASA